MRSNKKEKSRQICFEIFFYISNFVFFRILCDLLQKGKPFSRVVHIELRGAHPALYTTCHQQTGSCQHSQNDHTFQYSANLQCVPVSVPPLHHDGSFTTLLRRHHRPPSPSQGVPGKVRHRDAGTEARPRQEGTLFDRRGSC